MVNKKIWLGILVLVLVFGMTIVGCGGEEDTSPVQPLPPPQPGDYYDNPIDRIENGNLGTMTSSTSGWRQLLTSIENTGKYINLDLSACTMNGTSFNPDYTVATGKRYIVSIILPTVATSIEAGTFADYLFNSVFKNFSNLKSISGANIITIGDYSFDSFSIQSVDFPKVQTIGKYAFDSSWLESINFPLVQTIGERAFNNSYFLKNASFPKAETIGVYAFYNCEYLESISFPASAELGFSSDTYSNPFSGCKKTTFTLSGSGNLSVIENGKALVRNSTILLAYPSASGNVTTLNNITALDGSVFSGCSDLTGINLPNVITIGSSAFSGCSNIQDLTLPKATSIGSSAFSGCSRLQSVSIPLVTNIGQYAFQSPSIVTITMGATAPTTLDWYIFGSSSTVRTVTVKIPSGATGYTPAASPFTGTTVTVSGTNTAANWANGLRGGGWNGYAFLGTYGDSNINSNITLTISQSQ